MSRVGKCKPKKKIISRWHGYHGSGVMTGSLVGLDPFHNAFDLPRGPILHTEAPYYFRRADRALSEEQPPQNCAEKFEEMMLAGGPEAVAAFHRRADPRRRRASYRRRRLLVEDSGRAEKI